MSSFCLSNVTKRHLLLRHHAFLWYKSQSSMTPDPRASRSWVWLRQTRTKRRNSNSETGIFGFCNQRSDYSRIKSLLGNMNRYIETSTEAESGHHVSCSNFTFTDHFSRFAFTFHLHVQSSYSCFKFTFHDSCLHVLDSCIRDSSSFALIFFAVDPSAGCSQAASPPPPPCRLSGARNLMGLASPMGTYLA